jgi:hypothetical protein
VRARRRAWRLCRGVEVDLREVGTIGFALRPSAVRERFAIRRIGGDDRIEPEDRIGRNALAQPGARGEHGGRGTELVVGGAGMGQRGRVDAGVEILCAQLIARPLEQVGDGHVHPPCVLHSMCRGGDPPIAERAREHTPLRCPDLSHVCDRVRDRMSRDGVGHC